MIRCIGFYLVGLVGLMCCQAMADVAPVTADPGIADTTKTDLSLTSNSAGIADITQKVQDEVTKLAQNSSDPATVTMIRQWLVGEIQSKNAPGSTSPAYEEAYASALNTAFMQVLVQPSTPVNTRLNIGIVIKSLPGRTEKLAPSVMKLLQDKSAAVVLWGERAAGALLPTALKDPAFNAGPRDKLLAAIIDSVSAHPNGPIAGMIADEANQAINPKLNWPSGLLPEPAVLLVLIKFNLELQQVRLDIYKNSGVPDEPVADTYASYLTLGHADVWNAMTTDQQLQAAQQASDFVALAGQRAAGRLNNQNDDLIQALQEEGRWIQELGGILNDPTITAAGLGVNKLSVASPMNQVHDACAAVLPAFQGNNSFSGLKDPPSLGNAKTPADASAPAAASEAQQ